MSALPGITEAWPTPRRAVPQQTLPADDPKAIMAEIVAEGGSVEYASRALRLSPDDGAALWASICADVGERV